MSTKCNFFTHSVLTNSVMFIKVTETSILSKILFFFFVPVHDCDLINVKGKKSDFFFLWLQDSKITLTCWVGLQWLICGLFKFSR